MLFRSLDSNSTSLETSEFHVTNFRKNITTSHLTMKLFTISGAVTLFSILAPVTAMSGTTAAPPLEVSDQNRDFQFWCAEGRWYTKEFIKAMVDNVIPLIGNPDPEQLYPSQFTMLAYKVPGPLWYQPLLRFGPDDFVIFNQRGQIAGVAICGEHNDRSVWCDPCRLRRL